VVVLQHAVEPRLRPRLCLPERRRYSSSTKDLQVVVLQKYNLCTPSVCSGLLCIDGTRNDSQYSTPRSAIDRARPRTRHDRRGSRKIPPIGNHTAPKVERTLLGKGRHLQPTVQRGNAKSVYRTVRSRLASVSCCYPFCISPDLFPPPALRAPCGCNLS
jgi:hypothetical protein